MKIILLLLVGISGLWFAFFAPGPIGMIGHFSIDAILPSRLLESSTPAERMEMAANVQRIVSRNTCGWLAPGVVLALSLTGLILSIRRERTGE